MSQIAKRRSGFGPGLVLFMSLFAAQAAILVLSPILPEVAAEFYARILKKSTISYVRS